MNEFHADNAQAEVAYRQLHARQSYLRSGHQARPARVLGRRWSIRLASLLPGHS